MKHLIVLLMLLYFPMIGSATNQGDNNKDKEELITIVIKKDDLSKVEKIVKVYDTIPHIPTNKFQSKPQVTLFADEKAEREWIKELKISIGMGATYGIINNSIDVGPTLSVGYEFTF